MGDEADRGPFVPVPRAEQRRALGLLIDRAFGADALRVSGETLGRLTASQWIHWGSDLSFDGRPDYPFHEQLLGIRTTLLNQLTDPVRLERIRDAELRFGTEGVLTIPELFGELTEAIWSEAWRAPGTNIPAGRRDLQRAYLDRMTAILVQPPDRMPADARSVARVRLRDLGDRIDRRLTPPYDFDDYTYAHLAESRAQIEKALEAALELEGDS